MKKNFTRGGTSPPTQVSQSAAQASQLTQATSQSHIRDIFHPLSLFVGKTGDIKTVASLRSTCSELHKIFKPILDIEAIKKEKQTYISASKRIYTDKKIDQVGITIEKEKQYFTQSYELYSFNINLIDKSTKKSYVKPYPYIYSVKFFYYMNNDTGVQYINDLEIKTTYKLIDYRILIYFEGNTINTISLIIPENVKQKYMKNRLIQLMLGLMIHLNDYLEIFKQKIPKELHSDLEKKLALLRDINGDTNILDERQLTPVKRVFMSYLNNAKKVFESSLSMIQSTFKKTTAPSSTKNLWIEFEFNSKHYEIFISYSHLLNNLLDNDPQTRTFKFLEIGTKEWKQSHPNKPEIKLSLALHRIGMTFSPYLSQDIDPTIPSEHLFELFGIITHLKEIFLKAKDITELPERPIAKEEIIPLFNTFEKGINATLFMRNPAFPKIIKERLLYKQCLESSTTGGGKLMRKRDYTNNKIKKVYTKTT